MTEDNKWLLSAAIALAFMAIVAIGTLAQAIPLEIFQEMAVPFQKNSDSK